MQRKNHITLSHFGLKPEIGNRKKNQRKSINQMAEEEALVFTSPIPKQFNNIHQ